MGMDQRGKPRAKFALRALVSLTLLTVILAHVDWHIIVGQIASIELWPIGLSILLNAVGVALSVQKWKWFLGVHDITKSFARLHALYYMGFFFNNFLPSMVGGDTLRVINTAHQGRYAEAFSSVVGERGTGLATMLLLAGVAGVVNLYRNVPVGVTWLGSIMIVVAIVCSIVGVLLVMHHGRAPNSAFARHVGAVLDALLLTLRYPNVMLKALLVSVLFHILLVSNAYLFCYSVGLDLDFLALAVVFPVTILIAMAPVSINGLGVMEGSLFILLGQLGATTEQALLVAVLTRLFVVMASIVGGIGVAIDSSVKLGISGRSIEARDSSAPIN